MKEDKISEAGRITEEGVLRMPMDRLTMAFREHRGQRVIARFYFDVPGSSAAQQSYYYRYVVPAMQTALRETGKRLTEQGTDEFLLSLYPGGKTDTETNTDAVEAYKLNQIQMSDFLEWLKQFAAENLYVYIEDPKTL